jgi:hypothetical protein
MVLLKVLSCSRNFYKGILHAIYSMSEQIARAMDLDITLAKVASYLVSLA